MGSKEKTRDRKVRKSERRDGRRDGYREGRVWKGGKRVEMKEQGGTKMEKYI